MKTRRIAAAVLLAFLPATTPLPAAAQEDAVTLQARARFKEGVDAFDKGKYEEARLAFLQAYTLKKHPAVLLNLAQSSVKSNHPLEAVKYFQQFLKEAPNASAQQRKDAESGLAEARTKLGRIEVVAPPGTDISLDDHGKVGTTPMDPIDVEPGQHTVRSPTQSVSVTATAGQKVMAQLGGQAAQPPAATPPDAATTPEVASATPGADTGPSTKPGLFSRPENMTPVYIGLGVAGVGAVSALVFALFKADASSKADSVAEQIRTAAAGRNLPAQGICNNPSAPEFARACATLKDNNNKVDLNATIANISLGVAGAGLVFAGVWYLAAPKKDAAKPSDTSRTLVTPYATATGGGLSFAGTF